MFRDVEEIVELNINEECIIELKPKIAVFENKIIISDRTATQSIIKEKGGANRNYTSCGGK